MILGHVYIVFTTLAKPPKDKISICFCGDEKLSFWINTDPQRHGIGQLPLSRDDHPALTRDCYLDCSRVIKFLPQEMMAAKQRDIISPELALRITALLEFDPPKTVPPRFIKLAIQNLQTLLS